MTGLSLIHMASPWHKSDYPKMPNEEEGPGHRDDGLSRRPDVDGEKLRPLVPLCGAWTTTIKATVDGLIYALLTAGTFGWLWPR